MEVIITKSANKNKKFDAHVDGKKYHSVVLVTMTLERTKTLSVKNDI